jgi:oligopeptide transport system ATP-binding protein
MTTLIDVKGLKTRFFTQDGVVHAVNGISYHVDEGETLGIVGESGCGKSVSVLSVMRLIPTPPGKIVGGEVWFEGRDLLQVDQNEQVGEALQLHMGMNKEQARQRSIELLEMVNIPLAADRIDDYPHQFSGGMRQRAMIAMALSCNPQLLIADEPTTALDVTIQAQIIDLVKKLRDEIGMSIIWITHDLGIVAGLADRVVVMYAGYIIEAASCKDVYSDPRHPYTLGLLGSIPRLDEERKTELTPIEGLPPDLIGMAPGCPFAPRCRFQKELDLQRCLEEMPPLEPVSPGHRIACWVDVTSSSPR